MACILVSRSDVYAKESNDKPPPNQPGKLGAFDPSNKQMAEPIGGPFGGAGSADLGVSLLSTMAAPASLTSPTSSIMCQNPTAAVW